MMRSFGPVSFAVYRMRHVRYLSEMAFISPSCAGVSLELWWYAVDFEIRWGWR